MAWIIIISLEQWFTSALCYGTVITEMHRVLRDWVQLNDNCPIPPIHRSFLLQYATILQTTGAVQAI